MHPTPDVEFLVNPWPADWPTTDCHGPNSWPALAAHRSGWLSAIGTGLQQKTYLIQAKSGESIVGALPLNLVSGPIFGKFLVSMPYVNTGGVWAGDESVARGMINTACDLADSMDVKYLELRHERPVTHPRLNAERTDKAHLRLSLPGTADELLASLKSKVRSQVKKSTQYGLDVEFGGSNLLDEFYHVFAINMRDLGTPVFPRRLFAQILEQFPSESDLCVVRSDGKPAAAALLVHADNATEVPSASCLRAFNRMNANMFMYWQLLQRSIDRGSQEFDFGRSSEGSGTYKFKTQWGALPSPAVWQYYVRKGNPEDMRPDAGGKQRLIKIWQRLPVWLTKLIGPTIVRGIP